MVRELKTRAIWGKKKYEIKGSYYPKKSTAQGIAEEFRASGYSAIVDKRKAGHFVWVCMTKNKSKIPKKKGPPLAKVLAEAKKGPDSFLKWQKKEKAKAKKIASLKKDKELIEYMIKKHNREHTNFTTFESKKKKYYNDLEKIEKEIKKLKIK